jgi:hypothetical protein
MKACSIGRMKRPFCNTSVFVLLAGLFSASQHTNSKHRENERLNILLITTAIQKERICRRQAQHSWTGQTLSDYPIRIKRSLIIFIMTYVKYILLSLFWMKEGFEPRV